MKICCIVNSKSVSPSFFSNKILEPLERELQMKVGAKFTSRESHCIELTREAINENQDLIVGVGGDGTLNEMINAYMNKFEIQVGDPIFTLLPYGTGNDFSRTLKLNRSVPSLINRIKNLNFEMLDVCKINFTSGEKKFFINSASLGFSPSVVKQMKKYSMKFLGNYAYYIASIGSFFNYKKETIKIKARNFDWEGKCFLVAFSKGEYMGGGMKLAQNTGLQNGKMSVTIIGDINFFDFIPNLLKVSKGKAISHPEVNYYQSQYISFENINESMDIEFDGEYYKDCPESIECIPGQLKFL